jgi:hypothetical protein
MLFGVQCVFLKGKTSTANLRIDMISLIFMIFEIFIENEYNPVKCGETN